MINLRKEASRKDDANTGSYSHLDRVGVLVLVHQLQPVVLGVDNDQVSRTIKGNLSWIAELAGFVPGPSEDGGLILVDDEDTVEANVYDEDLVIAEAEMTALGPEQQKF